jgi:predicted nucleic acid-binding protein
MRFDPCVYLPVWVEHLRTSLPRLAAPLLAGEVLIHPWVIGEIACNHLRSLHEVIELLQSLPAANEASSIELLLLIERLQLMGCGIGWVDVHLLASAKLSGCALWTLVRRLAVVAREQGVMGA